MQTRNTQDRVLGTHLVLDAVRFLSLVCAPSKQSILGFSKRLLVRKHAHNQLWLAKVTIDKFGSVVWPTGSGEYLWLQNIDSILALSPEGQEGLTTGEVPNFVAVDMQKLFKLMQEPKILCFVAI